MRPLPIGEGKGIGQVPALLFVFANPGERS